MSSSGSHRIPAAKKPSQQGSEASQPSTSSESPQRVLKPRKSNIFKSFILTTIVIISLLAMIVSVASFVSIMSTETIAFGYEPHELPGAAQKFATDLFFELTPPEWIPEIGRNGRGFGGVFKGVGELDYRKLRAIDDKMLKHFDGTHDKGLILLSITGLVFNVSSGANHYAKGGGYHFLAGKDATISFVTGCFDEECFKTQDVGWKAVDGDGARIINDWLLSYKEKYPLYGKLDKVYELYHTDHPSHRHSKFSTPINLQSERSHQPKNAANAPRFQAAKLPKMDASASS